MNHLVSISNYFQKICGSSYLLFFLYSSSLIWAEDVLPRYRETPQEEQSGSVGPPPRRRLTRPYEDGSEKPVFNERPENKITDERITENGGETQQAEPEAAGTPALPEGVEPPIPPFPNYPESTKPKPPRNPKQEYLYLNHLYFEPLALGVGGFWSFGYLGMVGSGKALRVGLDIYNAGTNMALLIEGVSGDTDYQVTGILLRLGIHFFLGEAQPKGFAFGIDLRSGLLILPSSGNAVVIQGTLEMPVAYRFILTFYSRTGRPTLNLGIAPYMALSVGAFVATSTTTGTLSDNDKGFSAYLSNGNLFIEPNFVSHIDPIGLRVALRFGLDISFVF